MKNPCLTCKTPYPPSFPDEGFTCAYQEDSAIGDACPLYERYKASMVQIREYLGPRSGICGWCDQPVHFTEQPFLKPSIFEGNICHVICVADFLGAEEDVFASIGYEHIKECFRATQQRMCLDKDLPNFMPLGACPNCHRDYIDKEIMMGNDGNQLVTGCRWCGRSFCD